MLAGYCASLDAGADRRPMPWRSGRSTISSATSIDERCSPATIRRSHRTGRICWSGARVLADAVPARPGTRPSSSAAASGSRASRPRAAARAVTFVDRARAPLAFVQASAAARRCRPGRRRGGRRHGRRRRRPIRPGPARRGALRPRGLRRGRARRRGTPGAGAAARCWRTATRIDTRAFYPELAAVGLRGRDHVAACARRTG